VLVAAAAVVGPTIAAGLVALNLRQGLADDRSPLRCRGSHCYESPGDAIGCSLFQRAARVGTPRSPVPSVGLRLGVPSEVLLNASAQPEKRQDSDDDDDHTDDVDDVGHDLLLRVR
jgi:hypothetical protein